MTGKGFFRKLLGYLGLGCRSSTSRGVTEPRRILHPSTSQPPPQQPPPLSDDSSSEHPSPRAHFPSSPGRLMRSYSMNNTTDLNPHQLQFLRDYKPARRDPSHKKPLREFVCLMCSESHDLNDIHYNFERKNQLRKHNNVQHHDAPFKCRECWNAFYTREDFNQHMLDYHPEDPRMERGESSTTFSALPTYSDSVYTMPYQDRNPQEVPESSRRASYSGPNSRQRGLADLGISQNTPNIPSLTHRAYTFAEGRSSSLQPTIAPLSERFYDYSCSFSQGGPSHEGIVSAAERNNNLAAPEASDGPSTSSSMGHGYVQLKIDMFIDSGFGRGRGGGGSGNI